MTQTPLFDLPRDYEDVHFQDWSDADGVYIYKITEMEAGSDYDYDENGLEIETEPEYNTYYVIPNFNWKHDTIEQCRATINELMEGAKKIALDDGSDIDKSVQMMSDDLNGIEE